MAMSDIDIRWRRSNQFYIYNQPIQYQSSFLTHCYQFVEVIICYQKLRPSWNSFVCSILTKIHWTLAESALIGFVIILLNSTLEVHGDEEDGHCIWYGIYEDEDMKKYNLAYNGPGFPLESEEAQEAMLRVCPEIYKNGENENIN